MCIFTCIYINTFVYVLTYTKETRENGRNVKSILEHGQWLEPERLEAGRARDGCLKPRILGGPWSSARPEGLATAAGSRRYWRKRLAKGPCRGQVMDLVGRAAGLDKTEFLERFFRVRGADHPRRRRFWEHCTAAGGFGWGHTLRPKAMDLVD